MVRRELYFEGIKGNLFFFFFLKALENNPYFVTETKLSGLLDGAKKEWLSTKLFL